MTAVARAERRRSLAAAAGVIAVAALAGYLITCAIYPAPILPRQISVPALRGIVASDAVNRLGKLGLRGRLSDTVADPLAPAGTISWQSPASETILPEGALVKLGVSSGAPVVTVPDMGDFSLDLAQRVLEAAGLRLGAVDTVRNGADFGTVLGSRPESGRPARPGDIVSLSISSGPASVRVPDLVGLTVSDARERLAAVGLRIGALEQRFEGKAGTVLAQRPAPGEFVLRESSVDLTISGTLP